MTPRGRSRLESGLGVAGRLFVLVFLVSPAVVVVVLSFSDARRLTFPPTGWSLRNYESFFASAYWLDSLARSIIVAGSVAACSLILGVPTAYAIVRTRLPFAGLVQLLALLPLVLAGVAYAAAIYVFYAHANLLNTTLGLVMAHTVLAVPFVVLVCSGALTRIPVDLEHAAMSLGASRVRAMIGITGRLLTPAVVAAALLSFFTSFDEGVFVQFIAGPEQTTLPKAIFDSLRTGLDPLVTAIATLMMAVTAMVSLVVFAWTARSATESGD